MKPAGAVVRGVGSTIVIRRPRESQVCLPPQPIAWPITRLSGRPFDPLPPVDAETLSELFPGRWKGPRPLPEGLEPIVEAYAIALERAGWWTPGSEEPVRGSLILGTDTHFLNAGVGFAEELARTGPAGISPTSFLFSLPSSATAVLGILFGLCDYQATVTEGGLSGFLAVAHALDLLSAGRVERVAVGALSMVHRGLAGPLALGREDAGDGDLAVGVALCLEAWRPEAGSPGKAADLPRIEECCILEEPWEEVTVAQARGVDPAHRGLAASGLLAVSEALYAMSPARRALVHRDPARPGVGCIRVSPAPPLTMPAIGVAGGIWIRPSENGTILT